MQLDSPAFPDGGTIPIEHATRRAGGSDLSIPYEWRDQPEGTRSLALALIDVAARDWIHWLVVDIPPDVGELEAGASRTAMPAGARELANTFGDVGWGGPQPPPGSGTHRYVARIYALDVERLDVGPNASFAEFTRSIQGHVLAQAEHTGLLGK